MLRVLLRDVGLVITDHLPISVSSRILAGVLTVLYSSTFTNLLGGYEQQIAPRQGPMRVREFTMAEIEHFVNPDDKSHPKFKNVADLEIYLFPRAEQTALESHVKMRIGDAVEKVIILDFTTI